MTQQMAQQAGSSLAGHGRHVSGLTLPLDSLVPSPFGTTTFTNSDSARTAAQQVSA